jgi:hypothetical protein
VYIIGYATFVSCLCEAPGTLFKSLHRSLRWKRIRNSKVGQPPVFFPQFIKNLKMRSPIFRDVTVCSTWNSIGILQGRNMSQARNQYEDWLYLLSALCDVLVSCLACYLTLKSEATCSSATMIEVQMSAVLYIAVDGNLHNHRDNLKYCTD